MLVAIPLIVFGIEYFLHPEIDARRPPVEGDAIMGPLPFAWAYLTGIVLVICGAAILLNKYARSAAAVVGLLMTLISLFLYAPILAMAPGPSQVEALNYVADTLLFGGVTLFLAQALYRKPATVKASS